MLEEEGCVCSKHDSKYLMPLQEPRTSLTVDTINQTNARE